MLPIHNLFILTSGERFNNSCFDDSVLRPLTMRCLLPYSISFLFLATIAASAFADIQLHVAMNGSDANTGSQSKPFASITKARDTIRSIKSSADWTDQPIVVWIHGGHYTLPSTIAFTEQDSGTERSPITYRNVDGEKVTLCGGLKLTESNLVADESLLNHLTSSVRPFVKIYKIEIEGSEHFSLHRRALGIAMEVAPSELFAGESALPRAGWPNRNWATIEATVGKNTWELGKNIDRNALRHSWVHGFWTSNDEDSFEKLDVTDGSERTPNARVMIHDDSLTINKGARYRLENVLSELDSAGEWFYEPTTKHIVLWPEDDTNSEITVSSIETALSFYDTSFVTLDGLNIEGTRAVGIEIVGGDHITVQDCTVRYVGNVGLNVYHGHNHTVANCHIHGTGSSGIRVEGGHRTSLDAANHLCEGNEVHHCGYSYLAQRPAIAVHGVGIAIKNNHIHDQPDSAVILNGNDHLVEGNKIHHVCQMTADTGAIYIGHNPTYQGNQVVRNYIFNLGGYSQRDVVGIYLDDFASGTTVKENVLHRAVRGIAIGGGRNNSIDSNVIVDCLAGIQIDNRGSSWAHHHFEGDEPLFHQHCNQVAHSEAPYADRYPHLKSILEDEPHVAKGNVLRNNVIECPIKIDLHDGLKTDIVKIDGNRRAAQNEFANIDWTNATKVMELVTGKSTNVDEIVSN